MTPDQRLEQLANGTNPTAITQMPSGFAVMGDHQYLPGYCLLLAYPKVSQLNDLSEADQLQFLKDMACLGGAIRSATECVRVNYGIYGNLDPFLHAHIWPRYDWENDDLKRMPPFTFPATLRENPACAFSPEKHGPLKDQIASFLIQPRAVP